MGSDSEAWGCLIVGVILIWAGMAFLTPDDWRIHYTARTLVLPWNVYVDRKPKDCDFWHAPVGNKDCSYEPISATVTVRKAADGVNLEASWDAGKTWSGLIWTPSNLSRPTEPGDYAYVYWNKKTGE